MKLVAYAALLVFNHPTERPIQIGTETYTLRLTPLACDPKVPCGTPFVPRRYRGEVLKDGEVIGKFDRPCVGGVCEGMEGTVRRAIGNTLMCEREAR